MTTDADNVLPLRGPERLAAPAGGAEPVDADDASTCPGAEELAAYVENRLSGVAMEAVEAHLAQCQHCCGVVARVAERAQEPLPVLIPPVVNRPTKAPPEPPAISPVQWWKKRSAQAAAGFAAASLLIFAISQSSLNPFREPAPHEALVAAVGTNRTVEGRLSGFEYGQLRSPTRGRQADNLLVQAIAAKMREEVERAPTAGNLHVLGLAQLQLGDVAGAIQTLQKAAARAGDDRPALYSDLSAAYLAADRPEPPLEDPSDRTARIPPADRPADRALLAASRALELDPGNLAAHFNRALALQALGRAEEAAAARNSYLALDSTSPWATEMRRPSR